MNELKNAVTKYEELKLQIDELTKQSDEIKADIIEQMTANNIDETSTLPLGGKISIVKTEKCDMSNDPEYQRIEAEIKAKQDELKEVVLRGKMQGNVNISVQTTIRYTKPKV